MATIKHVFTSPKADGADTDLVRPSDWNSVHLVTLQEAVSLSGNTAGVLAAISSGTLYLAGGNNITLSQNANSVTVSGGDTSQFLTTAMASNAGSNFVQANATIAGTNVTGTIASNVISLSVDPSGAAATDLGTVDRAELDAQPWEYIHAGSNLFITESPTGDAITLDAYDTWDMAEPPIPGEFIFAGSNITISESPTADAISIFAPDTTQFLTTAMASDAGSRFVNTSAGLNLTSISATFNSNSISLSVGPYITTARASTDAVGLNTAQTNVTWTVNSSGISLNAGGYAGTGFTSTTTAGTEIDATQNTAGLSMAVPNWLTTAMASGAGSQWVYTSAGLNLTNISATLASNSISLSVQAPSGATMRVSAGTASGDLTQVVFSNSNNIDFGLNGSTVTAQYSELMEGGPAHSPGDYIFAGSNVTVTESPTGEAVSISVADVAVTVSAGTSSGTVSRVEFADSNGVSFGLNGSTITASVGSAAGAVTFSAGTSSAALSSLVFSNSNLVSFGLNGSTLTGSVPATSLLSADGEITISTAGNTISLLGPSFYERMELDAQPWEYVFAGSNITISESPDGGAMTIHGGAGSGTGGSVNFSAGTASANLDSVVFADSNGISWGLNGSTITATVKTDYLTTARASTDAVGLNTAGTNITWTVNSSGISINAGAYLTTAMASNRGSDFVQATAAFAGTGAAGTIASAGISISVSDQTSSMTDLYLDRGELEAQPWDYIFAGSNITISESPDGGAITIVGPTPGAGGSVNFSAGTTSNNLTQLVFSDSNNVSFGLNGSTITADANITVGAGSATGNLGSLFFIDSNEVSFGLNANSITVSVDKSNLYLDRAELDALPGEYIFAGSNITISESPTADVISIFAPDTTQFLTTAAQSNQVVNSINGSTGVFTFNTGSSLSSSRNANSFTFGLASDITTALQSAGAYLTTAMASNAGSQWVYTSAGLNLTSISATLASNSITLSVGPYITTARASTDAIGLNTAKTNVTWTVNSSGLSFDAGGYAGTTTAATNATLTLNSAGLAISVGAGGDNSLGDWLYEPSYPADYIFGSNLTITEGTDTNMEGPYALTISAPATSLLTGVNCSISTTGSTLSVIFPAMLSYYRNLDDGGNFITGASAITQTSGSSIWLQPFILPLPLSASYLRLLASLNDTAQGTAGTTSANVTFSVQRTTTFGLMVFSAATGANSRSLSLVSSTTEGLTGFSQWGAGVQGSRYTVTVQKTYPVFGTTSQWTTSFACSSGSLVMSSNNNTLFTGPQYLDLRFPISLSAGHYWLGIGASTGSATNSSHCSAFGTCGLAMSLNAFSMTNLSYGLMGVATSASDHQIILGQGVWTTNALKYTTDSVGLNSISQVVSNPILPFQFIRQA